MILGQYSISHGYDENGREFQNLRALLSKLLYLSKILLYLLLLLSLLLYYLLLDEVNDYCFNNLISSVYIYQHNESVTFSFFLINICYSTVIIAQNFLSEIGETFFRGSTVEKAEYRKPTFDLDKNISRVDFQIAFFINYIIYSYS